MNPVAPDIRKVLAGGPKPVSEIARILGVGRRAVIGSLNAQLRSGRVLRTGKYEIPVYYRLKDCKLPRRETRLRPLSRLVMALTFGPMDTTALCKKAGVSQPAFSRLLRMRLLARPEILGRRVGAKHYYMVKADLPGFLSKFPRAK